ncbi:hypothetical protein PHJA_000932600 [Phtheirospermum japonicum]|uniref:Uncharacterized protein n=1 Tax=Phtheirospermum japonicum TaxID=374723 RepID=A0A830BQ52_9LAMI|nr:hypothetical protein PHJA_000932600 [Phtheirospermum japonicum]
MGWARARAGYCRSISKVPKLRFLPCAMMQSSMSSVINYHVPVITIVLKTGPARPVRPGTGHHTGPVFMCKPLGSKIGQTGQEPVGPVNL